MEEQKKKKIKFKTKLYLIKRKIRTQFRKSIIIRIIYKILKAIYFLLKLIFYIFFAIFYLIVLILSFFRECLKVISFPITLYTVENGEFLQLFKKWHYGNFILYETEDGRQFLLFSKSKNEFEEVEENFENSEDFINKRLTENDEYTWYPKTDRLFFTMKSSLLRNSYGAVTKDIQKKYDYLLNLKESNYELERCLYKKHNKYNQTLISNSITNPVKRNQCIQLWKIKKLMIKENSGYWWEY
ncbi:MAG: hypothetical protein ACTTGJ_03845 [Clostridium sp.]